jgi:transcriptional regulator with XRE-family HTH domain
MNELHELTNLNICAMIGKKFKSMRINADLTQKKLSELSGVSLMTISGFESGRTQISLITFIQLLRTLEKLELIEYSFLQPDPISPRLLYNMENKKRKRVRL